ncbi:valine--tRNA ligase [Candidatus Woesearchaeota archaeon]|nr:valine--tRNA ligase [Candidatus Woesearchaeota archaeon]
MELAKSWDKAFEPALYNAWKQSKRYVFDPKAKGKVYSIDTPPPYVNAPVHIGQVTTYCLMDMFARYHRMTGRNVLFPLGLDRNGLPIEMAAEKEFKVKLTDVPREKALEYCRKILEKASLASVESFLRCGISFNSWDLGNGLGEVYETDSPDYRALTQATFIDLWNKGLIYEDNRINNWCPGCQTTLADAEVTYEDVPSAFNDIVFTCKETGERIIIGTTRPELVCTCGMVIYHPDDERYQHLEGKTAITPLFNKEVPIKAHPLADPQKGTGIAMMCSAGDLSDIRFFREMELEPVIAINANGTMNQHAGFLSGLYVKEARKKMIEMLKQAGLVVAERQIAHRTPICERSRHHVEFIAMPEYYVKQVEFKEKMKSIAHQVTIHDATSRQMLLNWIDSVTIDWPISRRRYYATEVPVWTCANQHKILGPRGSYVQPWKDPAPVKECPQCKTADIKGDSRVFDTWFDSSISPLHIMHWMKNPAFFKANKPCSLRPQGKDIVRTWLYYTLLKCYLLTNEVIFRDVWINYHIIDEKGGKMSKSKGNVVNPKEVLDKFGAEPFRLWAVVEGDLTTTDFRCSFERIEGAGKTLTKLWNVARFMQMFPKGSKPKTVQPLDQWILNEMSRIVKLCSECYARYDFHTPAIKLRNFIWETFASHYLELVKSRAYNTDKSFSDEEQDSALYALNRCLELILLCWAPVLPMFTAKIYEALKGEDIHAKNFPIPDAETPTLFGAEDIVAMNSAVWKAKKDAGLSLKAPVSELRIPERLHAASKDIIAAHGCRQLVHADEVAVKV